MPGKPGRPRKPLADHVLNGTYRRDRHGPKPSAAAADVLTFPAASVAVPVPDALVADLAGPAQVLVAELWQGYQWTPATLPLLRVFGQLASRLHDTQAVLASTSLIVTTRTGSTTVHPAAKFEQQLQRALLDLLRQMDLER